MDSSDKSARSCFVGNIPYEATEEQLKEVFSNVGPVMSFKLVFDRDSGKPRGYGFCEYMDPETAASAMRNLNGESIDFDRHFEKMSKFDYFLRIRVQWPKSTS